MVLPLRSGSHGDEGGQILLHSPCHLPVPQCLPFYRYVLLSRPFCFEPSTPYEVTVRLQRASVTQRHPSAFILIDSVRGSQHTPHLLGRWAGVGKPHMGWWTEKGRGGEGDEGNIDGGGVGIGVAAGSGAGDEDGDVGGMGPCM